MEYFDTILQAISVVGFPIVLSLILIYMLYSQNKNHKEEMLAMKKTVDDNTLAFNNLIDRLNIVIDRYTVLKAKLDSEVKTENGKN